MLVVPFFALVFLISAPHSPLAAQTTFGSITGTVTDQTGAVIPVVTVTVINEGTSVERRVATTDAGLFNVPNLGVGSYRVRIDAKGFRGYETSGVLLNANQVVNLDVQLTLAPTGTEVAVHGAAPVIDTETATLSNVRTSLNSSNCRSRRAPEAPSDFTGKPF
jgi:hypothetical protein